MSYTLPAVSLMQVKPESVSPTAGLFVIEPLSPGFGLTIGNALRRVLLSSLEGAAINSIRIEGVNHEFSTIKGVKEDVVDLILNLKQVRIKLEGSEPQVIVLDVKGPKSVVAGDFKCPTGVEITNRDLPIAEMVQGGRLLIEATVERGRGYVATESRREEKLPIGVIAIDAAFTPITLVNFEVENTRVGKMTNYDKLILRIETDGTTDPHQALTEASAILVDHYSVLAGLPTSEPETETVESTATDQPETVEAIKTPAKAKPKSKSPKS